jgi:phosphopantothenoylcysteine synthetase/decarboxylase
VNSAPGPPPEADSIVAGNRRAACGPKILSGARVLKAPDRPTKTSTRYASSATAVPAAWDFAVARAAVEQGARVQLVAGPVHLPDAHLVRRR